MKQYVFLPSTLFVILLTPLACLAKEPSPVQQDTTNVITLFMHPLDVIDINKEAEKFNQALTQPGKLTRRLFKERFKTVDRGVYVAYSGFVDRLNANGQVIFPRKNQSDTVTIIVTRKITPVILRGNTVEFFIRNEDYPIQYYETTRIFDKDTNFYYWETKKIPTPTSKKIPPAAIIFFAKPDQIYIPEGKTIAMQGQDLLLPPVYPTEALSRNITNLNALSFLNINKYFAPIKLQKKYMKQRFAEMIQP